MRKNRNFIALWLIVALLFAACGTAVYPPRDGETLPRGNTEPTGAHPPVTEPAEAQPSEPKPGTETFATEPPVTENPTTEPSVTEPPETEPLVTEPPVTEPPVTEPPVTEPPATQPTETLPPEAAIPNTVTVIPSGIKVKRNSLAEIDYSNTKDGYVMVRFTAPTEAKLKARVQGPATTYTYNLSPGQWAAFPLSDENGEYKVSVYENITGSKYAVVLSLTVQVTMTDAFAPFLRSNQFVDFDHAPLTVQKARELTAGVTDPLKKVEKIYDFVTDMTYDKALANSVQSGYTPDLDAVLKKMSGICFDYAALMTAMLRSQGVPAKLVVGYAGSAYHAWISVWSESTGWVDGVIYFDGISWKRMDPTFAASGGSDMLEYIGNGSNYTAKYFY